MIHSFTAQCATTSGSTVVWGNITPIRFNGYPLTAFAATTKDGQWRAATKITFANGDEAVVWQSSGSGGAPDMLSPFISYPAGDAVKMTIILSRPDGKVVKCVLPLTPSPDGTFAYYLHHTLTPFAIKDELVSFVMPAEKRKSLSRQNAVAVADIRSPLAVTVEATVSQGVIHALTPAVRSSSSWDFARSHLYAFSSGGIYAVSVNARRDRLSSHILDPREVSSPHGVTTSADAVIAVASGDLIAITGSRAKTLERATGFSSIGWGRVHNELWCADSSGAVSVRALDKGNCHTRDVTISGGFFSSAGNLFFSSGSALFNASVETVPDSINISVIQRQSVHGLVPPFFNPVNRLPAPSVISFSVFAEHFSGSLSLKSDSGRSGDNTRLLTTLDVNGPLKAPLPARVYAPPGHSLVIEISGRASPDTLIYPTQILFS